MLGRLSGKIFKTVHSCGRRRRFAQNAHIWQPEDAADKIYLAESGRVRIFELKSDGTEVLLEIIDENEFFGESCFGQKSVGRRKTLARAATDCTIIEFPVADFARLMLENPELMRAFVASAARRLASARRRISILSSRTVEKRLGATLLYLASSRGIRVSHADPCKIKIFVTHGELAALTAVSRQRITKTMIHFRNLGLMEYDRTKPLVVDVSALKKYVGTQN